MCNKSLYCKHYALQFALLQIVIQSKITKFIQSVVQHAQCKHSKTFNIALNTTVCLLSVFTCAARICALQQITEWS